MFSADGLIKQGVVPSTAPTDPEADSLLCCMGVSAEPRLTCVVAWVNQSPSARDNQVQLLTQSEGVVGDTDTVDADADTVSGDAAEEEPVKAVKAVAAPTAGESKSHKKQKQQDKSKEKDKNKGRVPIVEVEEVPRPEKHAGVSNTSKSKHQPKQEHQPQQQEKRKKVRFD